MPRLWRKKFCSALWTGINFIFLFLPGGWGGGGQKKKKTHTFETGSNITRSSLPFLLRYWSRSTKWTEQEQLSVTIINKMKDPSIIFPTLFVRKGLWKIKMEGTCTCMMLPGNVLLPLNYFQLKDFMSGIIVYLVTLIGLFPTISQFPFLNPQKTLVATTCLVICLIGHHPFPKYHLLLFILNPC